MYSLFKNSYLFKTCFLVLIKTSKLFASFLTLFNLDCKFLLISDWFQVDSWSALPGMAFSGLTQHSVRGMVIVRYPFFSIWVFFREHSRFTGQQWNGEAISSPLYHFHPLHRHLDINRVICRELTSTNS